MVAVAISMLLAVAGIGVFVVALVTQNWWLIPVEIVLVIPALLLIYTPLGKLSDEA